MRIIKAIIWLLLISIVLVHAGCVSTSSTGYGSASGYALTSTGQPLSGVVLSSGDGTAISDTGGKWFIDSLPVGMVDIRASRDNYHTQTKKVEIFSGRTVDNIYFVMAQDNELYDFIISSVTSTSAIIGFQTRYKTKSQIRYGKDNLFSNSTPEQKEYRFSHYYELTGLKPATTYRIKAVAIDETGRKIESEVRLITTEPTVLSEPPYNLRVSKSAGSTIAQIQWDENTDVDFAGYVIYRSTSKNENFEKIGKSTQNSFSDMDAVAGKKYYYRVTRESAAGYESSPTSIVSFLMPGIISSNITWTQTHSPYRLTGDLTVGPDASLNIEKGVNVSVAPKNMWDNKENKIRLKVQGTLMIQGTENDPVSIYSSASAPKKGDWKGVVFDTQSDLNPSMIRGLNISHALIGIDGLAGIPEIEHSGFYSCKDVAVRSTQSRQNLRLNNLYINGSEVGISLHDNEVEILIEDSLIYNCSAAIIAKDNYRTNIRNNRILKFSDLGIKLKSESTESLTTRNIIGYGSGGTGIVCRGNDHVRRNTIHAFIGIELNHEASLTARSNLILSDNSRSAVGFLYTGIEAFSPSLNRIQNNVIWDIPVDNPRRYLDTDGSFLPGISSDMRRNPGLAGGNPFLQTGDIDFDYRPAAGSDLRGAGFDGEDVGAEDVLS